MNVIENAKTEGLILDGATGTMLIQAGLEGGKASEFWNLEKPEIIQDIHKLYFEAGSDIVVTNTFGGSPIKLKKVGLGDSIEDVNRIGKNTLSCSPKEQSDRISWSIASSNIRAPDTPEKNRNR